MATTKSPERLREIRDRIDNYRQTVTAIWAFISVMTWDRTNRRIHAERHYSVGRRMTRTQGGEDITPDVVVQISPKLGVIAEAKRTLPADEKRWDGQVEQLRSYDTDLEGWWTPRERISGHAVVLLIHQFHGPAFIGFLDRLEEERKRPIFARPFGVVEFGLVEQVSERVHLVLRRGRLRDSDAWQALRRGVPVPSEKVVGSYGQRAFYDSQPPAEYLMEKIWMDFAVAGAAGRVREEGKRHIEVSVSVAQMTDELQKAYGSPGGRPREVEYPKLSWVRDAMNRLVGLRLARRVDDDKYVVLYRHVRGDLIERFASYTEKAVRSEPPPVPWTPC